MSTTIKEKQVSKHQHGKPRNLKLHQDLLGRKGGAHDEQRLHIAERPKARAAWKKEVEAVLARANNRVADEELTGGELEMEWEY